MNIIQRIIKADLTLFHLSPWKNKIRPIALHYGMHYLMHVEYLQADCIMGCIIWCTQNICRPIALHYGMHYLMHRIFAGRLHYGMHYLMHVEYLQADCIALWDALFDARRVFACRLHYGMHYLMHVEYLQADCIALWDALFNTRRVFACMQLRRVVCMLSSVNCRLNRLVYKLSFSKSVLVKRMTTVLLHCCFHM